MVFHNQIKSNGNRERNVRVFCLVFFFSLLSFSRALFFPPSMRYAFVFLSLSLSRSLSLVTGTASCFHVLPYRLFPSLTLSLSRSISLHTSIALVSSLACSLCHKSALLPFRRASLSCALLLRTETHCSGKDPATTDWAFPNIPLTWDICKTCLAIQKIAPAA